MRDMTVAETDLFAEKFYKVGLRVKIANGDGTLIDVGEFLAGITTDENIDRPVSEATLHLIRGRTVGGVLESLAPLMSASSMNVLDDNVTYSPLLFPRRRVTIETFTLAIGDTPLEADWKLIFDGDIDSVDPAESIIQVVVRDKGGRLVNTWIEDPVADTAGNLVEEQMQDVLDANVAHLPEAVTLIVADASAFELNPPTGETFAPRNPSSILDEMLLLASLPGYDVRYKWYQPNEAFEFILYEPPRDVTTANFTFQKSKYIKISRALIDATNVRNVIRVEYGPTTNVPRLYVEVSDATSIAKFGRLWMKYQEPSPGIIDTEAEATALANAILSDLKDPLAEVILDRHYFWPIELNDIIEFYDNDVLWDNIQKYAVVGIRHEIGRAKARTTLTLRGKPAAKHRLWITKDLKVRIPPISIPLPPPPEEGEEGSTCWVHNSPIPHYKAIKAESFGRMYDTYSAWIAAVAGRWPTVSGTAAFASSSTYLLAGCKPLEADDDTTGSILNLEASISPLNIKKVWTRALVWLDSTTGLSDIYLGPYVEADSGLFPEGKTVFASYEEDYTAPGFQNQSWEDFSPQALYLALLSAYSGRWVSVIQYFETGITAPRHVLWVDGDLFFDSAYDTDGSARKIGSIGCDFGIADYGGASGKKVRYALVEFIDGDVVHEPYCGLALAVGHPYVSPPAVTLSYCYMGNSKWRLTLSGTWDAGSVEFLWDLEGSSSAVGPEIEHQFSDVLDVTVVDNGGSGTFRWIRRFNVSCLITDVNGFDSVGINNFYQRGSTLAACGGSGAVTVMTADLYLNSVLFSHHDPLGYESMGVNGSPGDVWELFVHIVDDGVTYDDSQVYVES